MENETSMLFALALPLLLLLTANVTHAGGLALTLSAVSANPPTIDAGQSAVLRAAASGGSGSGYAYTWHNGNSCAGGFIGTANASVSPTSTTTYCVSVTDSVNITMGTVTVTVNPDPSLTELSPATIDSGQRIEFAVTPSGGTGALTYLWSEGAGLSAVSGCGASDTMCTVSGNDSGQSAISPSVSVFATDAATPAVRSNTASASVTVYPALSAPTIAPVIVDAGQPATLSASQSNGGTGQYSYSWFDNGTQLACTSSVCQVTPATADSYTVEITDTGTGSATPAATATSSAASVTINPQISIASAEAGSPVDIGQAVRLSAAGASGGNGRYTTEQWYGAGTADTNSTGTPVGAGGSLNATDTRPAAGTYYYYLVVSDGNSTTAATTKAFAVAVNPALTAPLTPAISSNATVGQGQTMTITATIPSTGTPPYSWQWLYSTDGGKIYVPATTAQCSTPSGSGASAGATETCLFATTANTTAGSYLFELKVTDSAAQQEANVVSAPVAAAVTAAPSAAAQMLPLIGTGVAIAIAVALGIVYPRISAGRKRKR
jgi:hypothetical protein